MSNNGDTMTVTDIIEKLEVLHDEIEKQPRYGVLGSLGLPMATWGSGKTMKMIEGLFLEAEDMMKLMFPDQETLTENMRRFMKHHVYYDYARQKLRKTKKDIRLLINELKTIE